MAIGWGRYKVANAAKDAEDGGVSVVTYYKPVYACSGSGTGTHCTYSSRGSSFQLQVNTVVTSCEPAPEDPDHSPGFYATPVPLHAIHGGGGGYDRDRVVFLEVRFLGPKVVKTFGLDVYGTSMQVLRALSLEETAALVNATQWISIFDPPSGLTWLRQYSDGSLLENVAVPIDDFGNFGNAASKTTLLSPAAKWIMSP